MKNLTYKKFQQAKRNKDLVQMKSLYEENRNENTIALEYAILLSKSNQYEEAKTIFMSLIKAPNKTRVTLSRAILELGKLECSLGDIERARICFTSLLNLSFCDRDYAKLELGKLEFKLGNIELARGYFESLINTSSDNYAKLELAKLELNQKNISLARTYFLDLINTSNNFYALLELGKLEVSQGNIEEARTYFKRLFGTISENYAKLELGKLEFNQGNIEEARTYFSFLVSKGNYRDKSYAKLELGRLEFSQGNIQEARGYFEELIKTSPYDRMYAILELGKLEFSQGNIEMARDYFQNLMSMSTQKDRYAMFELGKFEFSQGNIELAKNYFEDLLNSTFYDKDIYVVVIISLVKLSIKQNNYFNAFKYFTYLKDYKFNYILKMQLELLKLYIMKELNIFFEKETKIRVSYNNNQVVDYDEFVAIEHIIDGHKEEFSNGIDLYKLFNDIKSKLTEEYKYRNLSTNDIYHIPYENIGEGCHILRVVTLPNSKDILTMFPLNQINYNLEDDSLDFDKGPILQRKKV